MEILQEFEYPLPVIAIDTEKIIIETDGDYCGYFSVKNVGGGLLSGRVMSNTNLLKFTPDSFNANEQRIKYTLNYDNFKIGDVVYTNVVIMSNGGEKRLPAVIKKTPASLVTPHDFKIINLRDFLAYAKRYTDSAVEIFSSERFKKWLVAIGYEQIDILDYLLEDMNKERALDNFFIISKLKKKNALVFADEKIEIELKRSEKNLFFGSLRLKKTSWGFYESSVYLENNSPWIKLGINKVTDDDFIGNSVEAVPVNFSIDPFLLKTSYASEKVCIAGDKAEIIVKKLPYLKLRTSKEVYGFQETGKIIIENNSGMDLLAEVFSHDGFIKFEAKKYPLKEYTEVMFNTKLTFMQSSQLIIKNQPYLKTYITVSTTIEGNYFKYNLPVAVGEF